VKIQWCELLFIFMMLEVCLSL